MTKTTNIVVLPPQDENAYPRSYTSTTTTGSKGRHPNVGERTVLANITNSIGALVRGLKIGKKDNKRTIASQTTRVSSPRDENLHILLPSPQKESTEEEVVSYCSNAMDKLSVKDEYFVPNAINSHTTSQMKSNSKVSSGQSGEQVYDEAIYRYLRTIETKYLPPIDFMEIQSDITPGMRSILVDWLIEVQVELKLLEETLFLAVNIMDRFLSIRPVSRRKLQLIGMASLLIACKYEELECPYVDMFVDLSDNAYTRDELIDMERIILVTLEFNVTICTVSLFITRFLYQLSDGKRSSASDRLTYMSFMLAEMTLLDDSFARYSPSLIASASISLALSHLASNHDTQVKMITGHEKRDVDNCCHLINNIMKIHVREFMKPQQSRKIQAIMIKYDNPRYLQVAKQLLIAKDP